MLPDMLIQFKQLTRTHIVFVGLDVYYKNSKCHHSTLR